MNKISVILCDDHPLIIQGLEHMIRAESDMDVICSCHSDVELQQKLSGIPPELPAVMLLDLHLPDADGLDICRRLKNERPAIGIIAYTSVEDPSVISAFIRNGGRGYLVKSCPASELTLAIRSVSKGEDYISPAVTGILVDPSKKSGTSGRDYIPKLSMREKEVLQLIIQENTTQEISSKLFISVNTVETHRNHLLQKLGAKNLAGLVRIAIEKGLC